MDHREQLKSRKINKAHVSFPPFDREGIQFDKVLLEVKCHLRKKFSTAGNSHSDEAGHSSPSHPFFKTKRAQMLCCRLSSVLQGWNL